jgi:hypothetical protein
MTVGSVPTSRAGIDRFWAFGGSTQYKHWFTKGWCFFLKSTGVGEQQRAPLHRRYEAVVIQRLG